MAFMTEGKRIKSEGNYPRKKYFKCGKYGHYKSRFPEKEGHKESEKIES